MVSSLMVTDFSLVWMLIAIPAVMAGLLLSLGKVTNSFGHFLATLAPLASFTLAVMYFLDLWGKPVGERTVDIPLYTWISSGSWQIEAGLLIDPLSILFVLLITGVGSLIHIYSLGYMAHDPHRRRFFAYLNLFIAAMLLLVLANNYLVLFVGWEGVGLASYLLISFWQEKPSAAAAGKKAFIVNRVGDMGLLIAAFTMLAMFSSTSFVDVSAGADMLSPGWATFIGIMLLVGACGKSAQVPLQSWLLDAMEGPTPVSALIHAATMVTAGVYLVVRSGAIFEQSPIAQLAVAIVGTVTLLVGAWIGCSKDDIKKVLAGSTMSQIGYMMLAAGIGPAGYAFAIFHLLTHGFFKANMFLGAGSVMHATNDDVDMRHYGALRQVLPITFVTFAMGYLAIIGFPMFAGFYSKDHIIEAAFHGQPILGVLALIGAGVTAFYMTRLMMMTFFGQSRWRQGVHPHESPAVMWIPLVFLAIGSLIGGMALNSWIGSWLAPIGAEVGEHTSWLPAITPIGLITMAVVGCGVALGWLLFKKDIPDTAPQKVSIFTTIGRNDLFGDVVNDYAVVKPAELLSRAVATTDEKGITPGIEGFGRFVETLGTKLRVIQNGYVRTYGLTMVIGIVFLGLFLLLSRLV
ncbi:MAG: NADH-quinone oxidoreductase subunit L [Propionibacteriaceae bacterium]|nr:NADH-quinone oxidoreductase subunit L [Propionibacteriaceae bacterium]